jgi:hypothetical protein
MSVLLSSVQKLARVNCTKQECIWLMKAQPPLGDLYPGRARTLTFFRVVVTFILR